VAISSFFAPEAAGRVRDAVAEIEGQSSAEVVVALRHSSGKYRHTDYLVGTFAALSALCVFLYYPDPFDFTFLPLELCGCFAMGAFASAFTPPLQRLLTSRELMAQNVHNAARALFVDRGITRTRARTGVLVYLSMLERRVEIVADTALDDEQLGAPWREAKARLAGVLAASPSLDAMIEALRALGPALSQGLPRGEDDVNELPDEVVS
jgi:putative membrane protein